MPKTWLQVSALEVWGAMYRGTGAPEMADMARLAPEEQKPMPVEPKDKNKVNKVNKVKDHEVRETSRS